MVPRRTDLHPAAFERELQQRFVGHRLLRPLMGVPGRPRLIYRVTCFTVLLFVLLFESASVVDAQAPLSPAFGRDASTDTGVRPYVPYAGVQENINLTNGNLNLKVPLLTLPGRNGHDFTLELQYDSKIFKLDIGYDASSNSVGGAWMIERRSPNDRGVGWRFNIPYINGFSGVDAYYNTCIGSTTVILSDGGRSIFNNNPGCPAPDQVPVMDSEDTSGMQLDVSNPNDVIAILRDGTRIHFPSFSFCQASKIVYPDGNVITFSPVITDTLGRQITISYGSGNTTTITYKDSNGVLQTISLVYGGANLAY